MNRQSIRDHLARIPLTEQLRTDARGREDAQTLPFFERQLEQILAETFDREFPELAMANGDVIPLSSEVDEGAEFYTYYMYEPTGIAKFLDAYASDDLPMVSLRGAEVQAKTHLMGNQYAWTTDDIRAASFANRPLDSELARAARRGHDQLLHFSGMWGDVARNIKGFANHPNITVGVAAAAAGGGSNPTYWVNKTPEEIVEDVAAVIDGVSTLTNTVERVIKVAIADAQYKYIRRTRLGALGESKTILTYIQEIWPDVTFMPLLDLQAGNSQGNLTTDALIGFNDEPRKIKLMVPMPFRQLPVQQQGLKYCVPCESKTGGVMLPYPLSVKRLDGIGLTA